MTGRMFDDNIIEADVLFVMMLIEILGIQAS